MANHLQNYIETLKRVLERLDLKSAERLAGKLATAGKTGRFVFTTGNGGSAATAAHAVCDFGKTIIGRGRRPGIKAVCLNDNIPSLTAWSNDAAYKYIFSEQLKNLGGKADLFLPISASGNSPNIIEGIKTAKKLGLETFGLLGFDGGAARALLDDYLLVPVNDYGLVEDIHMAVVHAITDRLKRDYADSQ